MPGHGAPPRDTWHIVSWTPIFHVTGLIGTVMQGMYLGIPCTLLSTREFYARPISWLDMSFRAASAR